MRGRSSPNPPAPCNGFTIASLLLYVGGLPAVLQYLTVSKKIKELEAKKDATKAFLLTQIGDTEKITSPDFSISAGFVGPADVSYTREGYRNMRVFPKKHLKEHLENA